MKIPKVLSSPIHSFYCLARSHGLSDPAKSFYICKLNLQMFYTPSGALKDKKKCVL